MSRDDTGSGNDAGVLVRRQLWEKPSTKQHSFPHNPGEPTLETRVCNIPPQESVLLSLQVKQLVDETETSPVRAMCTGKVPAIPHHHLVHKL